jgi:probable F420-dependent oxidoreductase
MEFDFKANASSWADAASTAIALEKGGFSGVLYTEGAQVPWMMIAAAAQAAPSLAFSTGIAVAFPRSPMMTAQVAWELAGNTAGRFRMGLGSQVKAHVTRRYGVDFDRPAPRMRDYVLAVRACLAAFRREKPLAHEGEFYALNLLPEQWTPAPHQYTDIKIDISAVGPYMTRVAGEVADGIHVHPMHSLPYIHNRLLPDLEIGANRVGKTASDIDLIVPVFVIPGDTPQARASLTKRAKVQIGFYGSTPNYAFQFEDLGFGGVTSKLRENLRKGDNDAIEALITDEILEHFAVVARWDDVADVLISRYQGVAHRLVTYLAAQSISEDPSTLGKWCEVARAVTRAT